MFHAITQFISATQFRNQKLPQFKTLGSNELYGF